MNIRELLGRRLLFFDGAMGTLLQERGLAAGEAPEPWNLTHPETIENIHRTYLDAGCDIVKTNTFGANPIKLHNSEYTTEKVVTAAVRIARRAADACGRRAFVAMDIGPTGKLLRPLGDLDFEKAYDAFREAAVAGEKAGADLILIETMSDTYEAKAALLAAKENTALPVFVTLIFDEKGKLLTGGTVEAAVALLEGLGADAIGFNCGRGPDQMLPLLSELREYCSLPILINPNAGLPRSVKGKTLFDVGPDSFAESMRCLAKNGVWLLGGCCGTTPEHIRAMVERCRDLSPLPFDPKNRTVVSSYARAVSFGKRPVLIGERINPTGKKRFKQALRENDIDYILREGVAQQQRGAHILDVNVGLPEIDEPVVMAKAVSGLQSILDLPLQLDTSDPETMAKAMRLYNGKPLVNSVNGKRESMEQIFPLVKRYGGVVIALTLDENGIPETAEGRLAIAENIIRTAALYGIDKKDIVVDPLAMTVSAEQSAAAVTLEALQLIRERLGVPTSLGVSNISFGLPQRDNINAAFFTMAMQNGLGAAILNPHSDAMMTAYYSFCALSGADEQCMAYISRYSGQTVSASPAADQEIGLYDAILRGLKDSAAHSARRLLEEKAPLEIINQVMIPALDEVGKAFEAGRLFLPQLLMSADAAKAAFEAVRNGMGGEKAREQSRKEKVILATVKGDIHDIGKNIVKVLLDNYGYEVIDLGKDVAPEIIVSAAREQRVPLVGLSALMTTTVPSMEQTILLLHEEGVDCKVMVGGAVMTQEYADSIGADFYSPDAMGSVRYANRLFGHEQ
ncbi:MAG: dihydropteroate synthase [Clostridiales bacterium]|nr:dihydropteroate synthase [Clostridiales bacterium]